MKSTLIPAGLAFSALFSCAHATVLVSENFFYADGLLQNVSSWDPVKVSGSDGNLAVESGALTYTTTADTSLRTLYQYELGESVASGSLYYAFLFRASEASTTSGGQRIAGFGTGAAGTDSMRGQLWLKSGGDDGTFLFGISTYAGSSSLTNWWGSGLETNTDYLVVVKYDLDIGTSQLWIDPTSSESPSITAIDALNTSTRSTMGFYNRTNVNLGSFMIDDLVVGTSFGDVALATIPEPTSLCLLLALPCLLVLVRRRP